MPIFARDANGKNGIRNALIALLFRLAGLAAFVWAAVSSFKDNEVASGISASIFAFSFLAYIVQLVWSLLEKDQLLTKSSESQAWSSQPR